MTTDFTRIEAYRTAAVAWHAVGLARLPLIATAAAVLTVGLVGTGGGAAQAAAADTMCGPGETALLAVTDTTVTADNSSIPAWRTTVPTGETICGVAYDEFYQIWSVRLPDGREGVAYPLTLAEAPEGGAPTDFDYATERELDGHLYASPSHQADSLAEGGTVWVDETVTVDGQANFGTPGPFHPARTADGVTGWVRAQDLTTLTESTEKPAPAPTVSESAAPQAPQLSEPGFDLGAWAAGTPSLVWTAAGGVLVLVLGATAFLRRKRGDDAEVEVFAPAGFVPSTTADRDDVAYDDDHGDGD